MRPLPPDFPGVLLQRKAVPGAIPNYAALLHKTGTVARSGPGFAVSAPPAPVDRLATLFASLGLPADESSRHLLSFARHFSLPFTPAVLRQLRQEAQTVPATRPAALLGAVAAYAKGVSLDPEVLAAYVAAIDPDSARDQGGGTGQHAPEDDQDRQRREKREAPDGQRLKALADIAAGPGSPLSLLNRLPGPDGQHWLVIPFTILDAAVEFRVSLRLLLKDDEPPDRRVQRVAVDIRAPDRRWLVIVDRPGQEYSSATISMDPPLADIERGATLDRLRVVLAPYAGLVTLGTLSPDSLADARAAVPAAVDEEA